MNWFSVAARSSRSFVNCMGFRALSMSAKTCMGIIVCTCWAISSIVARWVMTLLLWGFLNKTNDSSGMEPHTRKPTCFPPPGLSRSFVESLITVVPRL
ncbi:uncharacterized protein LACBIDRAFT_312012 [Laccaria bicolor S238N-H82]|uniref:Predicted protein n=1 Tax=Laccaria bicolor (strain S238N-H82 / ATCC MYA-4686) TaxID=486041 RepID=B0CYV3_LACBS|nr:uncharacterized protein LACBIDRAFT_312012 [Laccaria bicolor S238N-H82]EDR12951.1 predicted protein [Laccaria bicolor S238N-H82]|eukprot:XP_001877215.1 predicted protein [Laccaria bicolor S238N-H82]